MRFDWLASEYSLRVFAYHFCFYVKVACHFYGAAVVFVRSLYACKMVTPFSAHCISDHGISDQKVRTVMVRAVVRVRVRVWVRVRLGDAVVRNAVGRKVGNHVKCLHLQIVPLV